MKPLYWMLLLGLPALITLVPVSAQDNSNGDQDARCANNDKDPGGPPPPQKKAGTCTFDAYTGNEFRAIRDLEIWGGVGAMPLVWMRYGNSRFGLSMAAGAYGNAHYWSSGFMYTMRNSGVNAKGQPQITVHFSDGNRESFVQSTTNPSIWQPHVSINKRLFQKGNDFVLQTSDGYRYRFEKLSGNYYQLQDFLDPYQNKYVLTYEHTRLVRITEPAGRFLQITYGLVNKMKVITQVSTSDGRSVRYHYSPIIDSMVVKDTLTDKDTVFVNTWVALDTVYYGDGTKASYAYSQSEPGTHPNLSHAIDPRVEGAGENMRYIYDNSVVNGFIHEERNGVTGELMATLNAGPINNVVCYPNGKLQIFTLPSWQRGNLNTYTDGLGRQTRYTYFQKGIGFIKSITDALGRKITYDSVSIYDNPVQITYADGTQEIWKRDDLDLDTVHIDELGRVTKYIRDDQHRVKQITYPDGTTESFTYNNFGQVLTRRRRNKATDYNTYDSRGLRTSFKDALGNITTYGYDGSDRLATITDARNNTTKYAYNERGFLTRIVNADGSTRTYKYDQFSDLIEYTNELGKKLKTTFDEFRRAIAVIDPLNRTTKYFYDLPGGVSSHANTTNKPTKIILPSGRTEEIEYDVEWEKIRQTLGKGTQDEATTFFEYDVAGNLTTTIDPLGKEWQEGYDKRNRIQATTDPLGHTTDFKYDKVGNLIITMRPDGSATTNVYDDMNRKTQTTDAKGQITRMTYDAEGNLIALTDASNNLYGFRYDVLNRPTRLIYPDSTFERYTYDSVSNLKTYTNRSKGRRTYIYDSRNREIFSTWTTGTPDVSRNYDAASNLILISSIVSRLDYQYDAANDLLRETQTVSGAGGGKTVQYRYNPDGLRSELIYPNGRIVTYNYTGRDQLKQILQNALPVVNYNYDLNGNRLAKALENGTHTNYTYDDANNTLSIDNLNNTASFARFDYKYDNLDRRTSVQRDNTKGDKYVYDAIDQITSASYNVIDPSGAATNADRTVSYNWDAMGNRVTVTENNTQTAYITNDLNQHTNVGGNSLTYDHRGNLTDFSAWMYTYDSQSRLVKATNGSTTASFAYDPLNRCVKRTIHGVTTFFYYDGWKLIEERNAKEAVIASYVHGARTDEFLKKISSADSVYYHTDALGSVVRLTNQSGSVIEQYSYDVFGKPSIKDGTGNSIINSAFGNRFLFTGREYIQELRLHDFRNRIYSDSLGRFLQTDPLRFSTGDYNLYRYVVNNPANLIDPTGLKWVNSKGKETDPWDPDSHWEPDLPPPPDFPDPPPPQTPPPPPNDPNKEQEEREKREKQEEHERRQKKLDDENRKWEKIKEGVRTGKYSGYGDPKITRDGLGADPEDPFRKEMENAEEKIDDFILHMILEAIGGGAYEGFKPE